MQAYGVRDAFRAHWDLGAGQGRERYFVAEVGGNYHDVAAEDVHVLRANQSLDRRHLGWPHCEGRCASRDFAATCDCAKHDDPLFSYGHHGRERCIIGGLVLRSAVLPAGYYGTYLYGEFEQFQLRLLTFPADGGRPTDHLFHKLSQGAPIGITASADGTLWVLCSNGAVLRVRYDGASGNRAPHGATIVADGAIAGEAPFTLTLAGMATDPDGHTLALTWDFGDGATTTQQAVPSATLGAAVQHTSAPRCLERRGLWLMRARRYSEPGAYSVQLSASDGVGSASAPMLTVLVGDGPEVTITALVDGVPPSRGFVGGSVVTFSAEVSVVRSGALAHGLTSGAPRR